MEFFPKVPKIDFMGIQKWTALFSACIFIASIISLFHYGLRLGLEFTGGTQIEVAYPQTANLGTIRQQLSGIGFANARVQNYGNSKTVLITLQTKKKINQKTLQSEVTKALTGAQFRSINFVGPQVGKELTTKGIIAVIVAMICTMIYILFRFELRFAISSTVALIHDPILILGVFSFFHLNFDLITLSALLAILGYSLNDTVVVFDRVRENFRKLRKGSSREIMNLSINETLSRTIMTSGLTLLVVLALFIYGGETLRGFSLALIIGIVIGTYSSIYVAGSLAVYMGLNRKDMLPKPKQAVDDRP